MALDKAPISRTIEDNVTMTTEESGANDGIRVVQGNEAVFPPQRPVLQPVQSNTKDNKPSPVIMSPSSCCNQETYVNQNGRYSRPRKRTDDDGPVIFKEIRFPPFKTSLTKEEVMLMSGGKFKPSHYFLTEDMNRRKFKLSYCSG